MKRSILLAGMFFLAINGVAGQKARPRATSTKPSTPAQSAAKEKFKAIWEPVSYPDDVLLNDAFFVTADEGWVTGSGGGNGTRGGVILHTVDGGNHWEVQYGDAQSSDDAVNSLRFTSPTVGWAIQGHNILHTQDGRNWLLTGTIPSYWTDYVFTSEAHAVVLIAGDRNDVRVSDDGGKNWRQTLAGPHAKFSVDGLTQDSDCIWLRLQFLSPTVGYAVGGRSESQSVWLAKTADGGLTWQMTISPATKDFPADSIFLNEQTGLVHMGSSELRTTDGGATWRAVSVAPNGRMKFADSEVGGAASQRTVAFTTDGGLHWISREYRFPVGAEAFTMPRRDRAYVVGAHGMIFRYRIVPVAYTAAGMIPAPVL